MSSGGVTRFRGTVKATERAQVPLKAFVQDEESLKILAEGPLSNESFDLTVKVPADQLPNQVIVSLAPAELKGTKHIKRLAQSARLPSKTISRAVAVESKGLLKIDFGSILEPIPPFLLGRRVCGRVVKRDPATGEERPVPGATVHVMDVDFNLCCWCPVPYWPFCWLFPFSISREEIATITTDLCGKFCVTIPWFDIDFCWHWRLKYICMPEIFKKPSVIDAIELGVKPDPSFYKELDRVPQLRPKPGPGPDPSPELRLCKLLEQPSFSWMKEGFGTKAMEPLQNSRANVLQESAFPHGIPPPPIPIEEIKGKVPENELEGMLERRPITRLLRCWIEKVRELDLFFDVPDIIFQVTQDTNGDGMQEIIYDEGFLDVNWNLSEPIGDVVIDAWENAISVPVCGPDYVPCSTTGFVSVGYMPVSPLYINTGGYAIRVNRPIPIPPITARPDAQTPFAGSLAISGCPNLAGASYYRIFYRFNGGAENLFRENWWVYHISAGTPTYVIHDINGYYPILSPPDDYSPFHLLLLWPSDGYQNGRYTLRMELYDAGKNPITASLSPLTLYIDHTEPNPVSITGFDYRVGAGPWNPLPLDCPIIHRPVGQSIDLRVSYNVGANYLRDLYISVSGCGGTIGSESYWHRSISDNNVIRSPVSVPSSPVFTVPASVHQGGYSIYLQGRSRAFTPDSSGLASDWYYDPLYIWHSTQLFFVILDT